MGGEGEERHKEGKRERVREEEEVEKKETSQRRGKSLSTLSLCH